MALKKISDDLQKRDSEYARREHSKTKYHATDGERDREEEFVPRNTWQHKFIRFTKEHLKAILLGVIGLVVVSLILLFVVSTTLLQRSFFNEENVVVTITGPDSVDGGEIAQYTIAYDNDNRADLENAELFLYHSDNFKMNEHADLARASDKGSYMPLGTVSGHQHDKIDVQGELYGVEGHVVSLIAVLRYTPQNSSTIYEAKNTKTTTIMSSPVSIDIRGPKEVVNGDEIDYSITYKNASSKELHDQNVVLQLPDGFTLLSATPEPTYDTVWELDRVAPQGSGTINIHGVMYGDRDEVKRTDVRIGQGKGENMAVFDEAQDVLRIVGSPVILEQTVSAENYIASTDDQLDYEIRFENDGATSLRNIVLTLEIDSEIVDVTRIDPTKGGTLDPDKNMITWKAVDVPELANLQPGDKSSVEIKLPFFDPIHINDEKDTHFVVKTVARIDSPDIDSPIDRNKLIASNTVVVKVDAPLILTANSYFQNGALPGQGPLPPAVGKETIYTIEWAIQRPLNDLKDVIVESSLPTGVVWKGVIDPENEALSFNQRTHKIEWNAGRVEADAAASDDARTVRFQVGLTPAPNQVREVPILLNESSGSAYDLFTERKLEMEAGRVSTQITDDSQKEVIDIGRVVEE